MTKANKKWCRRNQVDYFEAKLGILVCCTCLKFETVRGGGTALGTTHAGTTKRASTAQNSLTQNLNPFWQPKNIVMQ